MRSSFSEIFEDVTKHGKKIPKSDYLENGKYPIIDQGHNEIAGYYDSCEGIYMVNAVKVFTLRLCISAYYIHFKRVKVKIFTAFTIVMSPQSFLETILE